MRVVGLISGGKDSCYNMMQCIAAGHTIVALANIQPANKDELDSYMYQTVGHQGISTIAEAMELPLYRVTTQGKAMEKGRLYEKTENDEVEDLFDLLKTVKENIDIEGVAVGAILSDYQRVRVENVCNRLGLVSLSYLWRRDQTELLQEMIDCQVNAIIIKVAALGLEPNMLGRSISSLQTQFIKIRDKFGFNVCGEGGEYETFTLDCPLYKSKIVIDENQVIIHSDDPIAPVGYMNLLKVHLEPKKGSELEKHPVIVKSSLDYISDLNDSSYSDLSDLELSESELETTEQIRARRESMSESMSLNTLIDKKEIKNKCIHKSFPELTVVDSSAEPNVNKIARNNSMDQPVVAKSPSSCMLTIDTNNDNSGSRIRTNSTSYIGPLSPLIYDCEKNNIEDTSCIFGNNSGWNWIGGIVGSGPDSKASMEDAMNKLCNVASSKGLNLKDVCTITLYVRSMADYGVLNAAYVKMINFSDPPARVCVECPLPEGTGVILEAVAHKWPSREGDNEDNMLGKCRHTMHVQGVSHWAPANIGPYSQAVRVSDIVYIAGQIPLVPGSMTLAESDGRAQCRLALRHVQRLLNAMDSKTQIRDVVQAVCYLTHPWLIPEARRQWERRTNNAIVDYVVVPGLPRGAPLEWHVWAHRHNSRFEYEETGRSIGQYKVAIRRRWNYENNVAAIICHVATASSSSNLHIPCQNEEAVLHHRTVASQLTEDVLREILEYSIKKLNGSLQTDATIGLRIFYKVSIVPNVSILISALKTYRNTHYSNLTFTVVPVVHLQNEFTFLSLSAIRHETN